MTDTANLGLPCIEGSQAQKHVTHNEALRILDTLVQLAVLDRDLTAPPGSVSEGQRWIVKATATDAWAGHDDAIAAWQDGAWQFCAPQVGWLAYVVDEGALLAWDGSAWVDAMSALTSLNNMTLLGVGTMADATNPFSAKLNNILWVAKALAEGGDGDLRWKMSKEAAANTLSMLFQDNYSGRAEIGLTGDDDFHFKVSPDGSTWYDGITIDKDTGTVTFPNTGSLGGREVLTADRTYYVRTDGSDSNDGLTNSAGGAFLTPQKAMDVIAADIDVAGHIVTVQIGDGTYTGGVYLKPWVGGGELIYQGNNSTPANVFISRTAANCFESALGALPGSVTIKDMKLGTTTSGYCIVASTPCTLKIDGVNFAAASIHIVAYGAVTVDLSKNYTISGGGTAHWYCSGAYFSTSAPGPTITISGTPAFSTGFAISTACGFLYAGGIVFSGSATGPRYYVTLNGIIHSGGVTLPGSTAGSTTTGGQYL